MKWNMQAEMQKENGTMMPEFLPPWAVEDK